PYRWIFTIADVKQPIVGADFLQHHGLLIDIHRKTLIDSQTIFKLSCNANTRIHTVLHLTLSSSVTPFHLSF
uniref:Uncharacterized protein n=1 Tax=Amphimedon queenslandica TaxID=400682 RepID=A0A1X7UTK4_AMPQE